MAISRGTSSKNGFFGSLNILAKNHPAEAPPGLPQDSPGSAFFHTVPYRFVVFCLKRAQSLAVCLLFGLGEASWGRFLAQFLTVCSFWASNVLSLERFPYFWFGGSRLGSFPRSVPYRFFVLGFKCTRSLLVCSRLATPLPLLPFPLPPPPSPSLPREVLL